ncbi:MAG TPA: DUF1583 domain-containing protein [Thermoguttaceae bacterium]|nr:DUF1583 domain-containing protein [Thermoguttaceae bacterium]
MNRQSTSTERGERLWNVLVESPDTTDRDAVADAARRAQTLLAVLLLPLLFGLAPEIGVSAFAQATPGSSQTSLEPADAYYRKGQFPEMTAVLDKVWKNDPESILKDSLRIGNYYADARQGDVLVRHIEALNDTPLLERYGDHLGQFALHFAHRSDQAEVAGRIYAAAMKVVPVRSRCLLAWEYGQFLVRQSRQAEAYEVYKLGLFPAPSGADGGAHAVPDQRRAANSLTGELSSPIIALADLAVDMQASDRLRADARAATQDMPKWKPAGDLLLAMLSRREGNEQPLADLGSRCINDPTYRARMAKLMGVLRQELSRCDGAEPLGTAESLWREAEQSGEDYEVDAALHQQALIQAKLSHPEEARQAWLKIVDRLGEAKRPIDQDMQVRSFVAVQLEEHGFPVDALRLARQILEADRSELRSQSYASFLIRETERRLVEALHKLRAGDLKLAKEKEDQVLAILLGLLFGEGAGKDAELGPGLDAPATMSIAESVVAFAKTTGQLAGLRRQWDAHPMGETLNLLALRAEAAMTDGDRRVAEQLLARISDLEQSSGKAAPLWSPACLFWGLDRKLKAEFRDDLRGSELDERVFRIMPVQKARELRQYVQPGPDGLHLRVPPASGPVGVCFTPVLRGDCEVTASYAIQHATQPDGTYGPGATLRVWTQDGTGQLAGFFAVNGLPADQGGGYVMNRGRIQKGKHDVRQEYLTASAPHGTLRVVRKGATLHFLAAEEGRSEFRRLHQIEFSDQNIVGIRLGVHPVDPKAGMDVRWQDLVVRAEQIVGVPGEAPSPKLASVTRTKQPVRVPGEAQPSELAAEPPGPAADPTELAAESSAPASEPRSWVWWVVVVCALALAGTGLWWLVRAKGVPSG